MTSIGMERDNWKKNRRSPEQKSLPRSNVKQTLLERFAEGDTLARKELFQRYERRLSAICLRILQQREDAEDALQETFFKASRTSTFDGDNFGGWIYRIAVNVCRDVLARRKRTRENTVDNIVDPVEPSPNPAQVYTEKVREKHMAEALGLLPNAQREALVLKYVDDLTTFEVAEILEVPVTTVEGRLREGRKRLRGILARRNFV